MFHYKTGINESFDKIAIKHFNGLAAISKISKAGNKIHYYVRSVIQRATQEAKGNGPINNFFKDLLVEDFQLLKEILTGDLAILKKVISDFKTKQKTEYYPSLDIIKINGIIDPNCFYARVKYVFDYDEFTKKREKGWCAYSLSESLGIKVCAYCNRNFTMTLGKPGMIVRPEFDHFLPKSIYPYLALSFYNLIPSCHICNSNLKHKIEFNFEEYLHPYDESFDDGVRFSIKLRDKNKMKNDLESFGVNFLFGDTDAFDIVFKARVTERSINERGKLNRSYYKKILNNSKVFKILELYNHHKDLVEEMIQVSRLYNDDYISSLYETYKGQLFNSREDVIRMVTRNYPTIETMPNRTFSKLTKDIFEELGLTY